MRRATWNAMDAMFAKHPCLRAETPMTNAEVRSVFKALARPVNKDYAAFLRRYGAAMVGPLPVFGLRPVEVMGTQWNVLRVNEHYRSQRLPGADAWVVMSVDHGGNPIGLADDGRVWVSDHEFGGVHKVAESFEGFLRRRCLNLD